MTGQALAPYDRIPPIGNGETPRSGNASGNATETSLAPKTDCRSSVSLFAVAGRGFIRPLRHLPLGGSPRERDCDKPLSFVCGFPQTRLPGRNYVNIPEGNEHFRYAVVCFHRDGVLAPGFRHVSTWSFACSCP